MELTVLLNAWAEGDLTAREKLFEGVYPEIKRIAVRKMSGRETLQPTEVVHEAFLKLSAGEMLGWEHRAQFFKLAARVVRQVLVDRARNRGAQKRGGGAEKSLISPEGLPAPDASVDLLELHEALERLANFDSLAVRVVELRYFGGLTISETARALEVGTATVSRRWQVAQTWLRRELASSAGS